MLLSTAVRRCVARDLITVGFTDSHAVVRSCLDPPDDYELPFHVPEDPLPVRSGPPTAGSPPTASFISFEVADPSVNPFS